MTVYNKVLNNLEALKLEKIRSYLPQYLDTIKDQDTSLIDSLYELLQKKWSLKIKEPQSQMLK